MGVPLPGCGIHPQPGTLPKAPCCLPTNPVCPVCLSSTHSWSRGQPCHSASGFPTSGGVCCSKRDYLLGFALIVMNTPRAVSLRSKCLPGRASWRIRGQDHHKVGKCMLTMVSAPLCCHL